MEAVETREREWHSVLEREWVVVGGLENEPERLAYDIEKDIERYWDLVDEYGEKEARRLLVEEMAADLLTYVGELSEVGYFAYGYKINRDGVLVEDTRAEKPIAEMFQAFDSSESQMWLEQLIPTLERMPVGASAFTLSVRKEGSVVEGSHDYAYYLMKVSEERIAAYGLELNLKKSEQVEIINGQIGSEIVDETTASDFLRQRVFVYMPGSFDSEAGALVRIVGPALSKTRKSWVLENEERLREYLAAEEAKLEEKREESRRWAESLTEAMVQGEDVGMLQSQLNTYERKVIARVYPEVLAQAKREGWEYVVLPCGLVGVGNYGGNGGEAVSVGAGDGFVSGEAKIHKCVECPLCHRTVDAIETSTEWRCPSKPKGCGRSVKKG